MDKIKGFEEITCEELNEVAGCLKQYGSETTGWCCGDLSDCHEAYQKYLSLKMDESATEVFGGLKNGPSPITGDEILSTSFIGRATIAPWEKKDPAEIIDDIQSAMISLDNEPNTGSNSLLEDMTSEKMNDHIMDEFAKATGIKKEILFGIDNGEDEMHEAFSEHWCISGNIEREVKQRLIEERELECQVLDDMHNDIPGARDYYKKHYATPEEIAKMDREDKIQTIIGIGLFSAAIFGMMFTIIVEVIGR